MQKYLRLLNLRLDVVVNDITGLAIIDTICKGEKNPETLAALRNGNCRKSATEIAKALHSNGRTDYLFALHCTKNMIFTNPFNKKYNSVVPPLKNSSRVLSTPMKIKKS